MPASRHVDETDRYVGAEPPGFDPTRRCRRVPLRGAELPSVASLPAIAAVIAAVATAAHAAATVAPAHAAATVAAAARAAAAITAAARAAAAVAAARTAAALAAARVRVGRRPDADRQSYVSSRGVLWPHRQVDPRLQPVLLSGRKWNQAVSVRFQ